MSETPMKFTKHGFFGNFAISLKTLIRKTIRWIRVNWVLCLFLSVFLLSSFVFTRTTCVFRSTIGVPCPGCGLTRAFQALLRGQISDAFYYHPLFWLIPLLIAGWVVISLFFPAYKNNPLLRKILYAAGFMFIAVYLVRMVLYFPDHEPMVYHTGSFIGRLMSLLKQIIGLFAN